MSSEPISSPVPPLDGHGESIVGLSIKAGIEEEKCVVSQYRTTLQQKEIFEKHLQTCTSNRIPIEWVIDIADESNGWFYGTAYHYDDTTQMIHVMVPDKVNPSFDGNVLVDHRTVHLIECVDGKTDALFNKIVRDSVVRVRWEVEWFEESGSGSPEKPVDGGPDESAGRWVLSAARYYIRMANQLLVEDENFGQDARGFVMLTADVNVRLRYCHKGKGQEDFNRLVIDGAVQSTPDALQAAKASVAALAEAADGLEKKEGETARGGGAGGDSAASMRKMADMSKVLRECIADLLDDREKNTSDRAKVAKLFKSFALDGDLDAGLRLLSDADEVGKKVESLKKHGTDDEDLDPMEIAAEDAWYLVQKLEKGTMKLLKAGGDAGSNAAEELEFLRKSHKKMKRELEEKERELQALRGAPPSARR